MISLNEYKIEIPCRISNTFKDHNNKPFAQEVSLLTFFVFAVSQAEAIKKFEKVINKLLESKL
jgi:hypothetical protein